MKQSRFTEEQMVAILREADRSPVSEVAQKHELSERAIYGWRISRTRKSLMPARLHAA